MKYVSREHSLVMYWLDEVTDPKKVKEALTPEDIDLLIERIADVIDDIHYSMMGDDA